MTSEELIVDSFAGGGGASLGIERALGRPVDVAINHDREALAMHAANHPATRHVLEDVWRADLPALCGGRPVGLLWCSPDCKHFSRAKGAKPVEKSIRSLAWVVVRWAEQVGPRIILLENVREFAEWGPLVPRHECRECGWRGTEGQARLVRTRRRCPRCDSVRLRQTEEQVPDPTRAGLTFRRWVGRLRNLGYAVAWRVLDAADYGAPTHRRRLFLVARRDGGPIVWPEPTHGDPQALDQTPLFGRLRPWRTAAECIDWSLPCPSIFERRRPLAEATLRRIAIGIRRYVLEHPRPFLIGAGGSEYASKPRSVDRPLGTTKTEDRHALVAPFLAPLTHQGDARTHAPVDPLPTITGARRGELAAVAPTLIQVGYSERAGQAPRALDLGEPLGAVVGSGKHAVAAAFLAKHFGNGVIGQPLRQPIGTVTSIDHHSVVAANLVHLNHGEAPASPCDAPARTVTASGNHAALVYAFLVRYFGTAIGQAADEPLLTATSKARFGLATVVVGDQEYAIVDVGLRMLQPRELARAQGFPDEYRLTGTKTNQVARIGNSVCPPIAEAMVRANCRQEACCGT